MESKRAQGLRSHTNAALSNSNNTDMHYTYVGSTTSESKSSTTGLEYEMNYRNLWTLMAFNL